MTRALTVVDLNSGELRPEEGDTPALSQLYVCTVSTCIGRRTYMYVLVVIHTLHVTCLLCSYTQLALYSRYNTVHITCMYMQYIRTYVLHVMYSISGSVRCTVGKPVCTDHPLVDLKYSDC